MSPRGKGAIYEEIMDIRQDTINKLVKMGVKLSKCPGTIGLARQVLKLKGESWAGRMKKSTAKKIINNFVNGNEVKSNRAKPRKISGFYDSREWRSVRYQALKMYERKCMCCGRNQHDHGIVIHVDHIKPRSTHPELELDVGNLQLMCEDCNLGKSNTDEIDYRPKICAYCNHKITEETKCSPDNPCRRPKYQPN